jgi:hypothetical protein
MYIKQYKNDTSSLPNKPWLLSNTFKVMSNYVKTEVLNNVVLTRSSLKKSDSYSANTITDSSALRRDTYVLMHVAIKLLSTPAFAENFPGSNHDIPTGFS